MMNIFCAVNQSQPKIIPVSVVINGEMSTGTNGLLISKRLGDGSNLASLTWGFTIDQVEGFFFFFPVK